MVLSIISANKINKESLYVNPRVRPSVKCRRFFCYNSKMLNGTKKIFFAQNLTLIFVIIAVAGYSWVSYRQATSIENPANRHYLTVQEEENIYVRFVMEAYDSIADNYWMKAGNYKKYSLPELPELFDAGFKESAKMLGLVISTTTITTDAQKLDERSALAQKFNNYFATSDNEDIKVQLAKKTIENVLVKLLPYGRNGLLSEQQRVALRQEVSNINPAKDLYQIAGAPKDATPVEIAKAVEVKVAALEKSTSTTAKAEIKEVKYAQSVLTDTVSKTRYDQVGAEPVVFSKVEGRTLYVYLKQVSPTTLQEFVNILNKNADRAELDSMIIDLRRNIGGDFSSANSFIGLFIGANQLAFDVYRKDDYNHEYTTQPRYPKIDQFKDIAILTDNGTQSTAEIISATLKKFKIAKIVGTRTAGWGTVENTYGLKSVIDPAQKYTLYLVNNLTIGDNEQPIQDHGVAADVDISTAGWKQELTEMFTSADLRKIVETRIAQKPSEVNMF